MSDNGLYSKINFTLSMTWQVLLQQNKIACNNNKHDCFSVKCAPQQKFLFPLKLFYVSKYLHVKLSF